MISSSKKRIIFCGNYRWFTPEWRYIDGDNKNMSYSEFFGGDYIKDNFLDPDGDLERQCFNRVKFNRVIDSSEYVVRCDFGKTSNPTSGFEIHNSPSTVYGSKTDILSFWVNLRRDIFLKNKKLNQYPKDSCWIQNHFTDLSIRMGIPSVYLGDNLHQDSKMVCEYYSSKMIASERDEFNKKESWHNMNHFYDRYLYGEHHDKYPETKDFFSDFMCRWNESISYIEDVHGLNIKYLSINDYIELCTKVMDCSITYNDLKLMIGHKEWAKKIFNADNSNPDWLVTEEDRSEWMDRVKLNFHVQRGTETIWKILADKRFEDYEKYIIGTMGINECFRISSSCKINQWGEYLFLSSLIKNEVLKYLPEHIDDLYQDYSDNISHSKFNLRII